MRFFLAWYLIIGCDTGTVPTADTLVPATAQAAVVADNREPTSAVELQGPRAAARHIVIAFDGAKDAFEVSRSKDDALALAQSLHARLVAGEDFAALARTHSDEGSGRRGGDLGVFTMGVMHPDFEAAVFNGEVGYLLAILETPFGFHLIERLPVEEIHVAHVLVQWEGLHRATTKRTRDEAEAHAAEALAALREGSSFVAVADRFSDGPTGKRGGDLGWFQRGQMVPAFDDAAFALAPGETTDVIESPIGLHIIYRVE
jgi:parvulin-like peptidyl-prolyl isomerase